MSDKLRNVYDVLEDDIDDSATSPSKPQVSEEVAVPSTSAGALGTEPSDGTAAAGTVESWTDVGRTRRLVPKYSLSKEVMGLDNAKRGGAPPTPSTAAVAAAASSADIKKKVIRFSREEILSLRRPSKPLPELEVLGDIIFPGQQDPECFKKLDADEVYRLWHAAPEVKTRSAPGGDAGRGRGRGRRDEESTDWSRGVIAKADNWDDIGAAGSADNGLDLADFSAATLKFRSEMGTIGKDENIELYDSNDVMEGLFREQRQFSDSLEADGGDDDVPEWADADVRGSSAVQEAGFFSSSQEPQTTTNAGGRAILNALMPQPQKSETVFSNAAHEGGNTYERNTGGFYGDLVQSAVELTQSNETEGNIMPTFSNAAQHSPIRRKIPENSNESQMMQPPVPSADDAVWMYLDPRNRPQGPFSTSSMQKWMADGYFAPTLPIKLFHWSDFHPLYTVYLDAMSAFQTFPNEPNTNQSQNEPQMRPTSVAEQEHHRPAYVEDSRQAAQSQHDKTNDAQLNVAVKPAVVELAAHPQQELLSRNPAPETKKRDKATTKSSKTIDNVSAVETVNDPTEVKKKKESKAPWGSIGNNEGEGRSISEIQAEEKQLQASSAAGNDSKDMHTQQKVKSSQLKSLLGLPASSPKESVIKPAGPTWGSNSGAARPVGGKTLREIQEEEERIRQQQEAIAQQNAAASIALSVQAAPKWKIGSAGSKAPVASSSPSLSEIMQQEEKARQNTDGGFASGAVTKARPAVASSWAAKAGKGGSGGSFNAVPISPVAKAPVETSKTPATETSGVRKTDDVDDFWNFPVGTAPASAKATPQTVTAPTQNAVPSKKPSSKNDFGGSNMPAATAEWCTEQLLKMKKPSDLTLIQFCYTLQSPVEIREYFAEFLGSTPQVSQFATEFISRKEGKSQSGSTPAQAVAAPVGAAGASKKKKNKAPK